LGLPFLFEKFYFLLFGLRLFLFFLFLLFFDDLFRSLFHYLGSSLWLLLLLLLLSLLLLFPLLSLCLLHFKHLGWSFKLSIWLLHLWRFGLLLRWMLEDAIFSLLAAALSVEVAHDFGFILP